MSKLKFALLFGCLAAVGGMAIVACNGFGGSNLLPSFNLPGTTGNFGGNNTQGVSLGRQYASRLIVPGSTLLVDVLQKDNTNPLHHRCDPLGIDPFVLGNLPWPSRVGGPVMLTPTFLNSEYDTLFFVGETEYCVSLRVPVEPNFPLFFTQVEFNFRAVNPWVNGHIPGTHFGPLQAIYPSNDDVEANRSLIDLSATTGGDVAVLIMGINFNGPPLANTRSFMNGLGPLAWLTFLRDNAFQSGRFYAISGALKGAPQAFADTLTPLDDGFFQSAQVNGDNFDLLSEPFGTMSGPPLFQVCAGAPAVGKDYAFLDLSNFDELGAASPGEGGFLFVMRREAFRPGGTLTGVVVDPSGFPSAISPGDQILAPTSGYNEPMIPGIVAPDEDNFAGTPGPQGVHELGLSVFFVHRT